MQFWLNPGWQESGKKQGAKAKSIWTLEVWYEKALQNDRP